ncbi:MAG: type II secretion system F family protein [Candidatus Micrarchaeota archaeon]|nr:type II secretion system F family protein [Candidatus Micrarchaeota archaeon]
MAITRIPFMFFSLAQAQSMGVRFHAIGVRIISFYPNVRYDLRNIGVEFPAEHYCSAAVLSALAWGVLVLLFLGILMLSVSAIPAPLRIVLPLLIGFLTFLIATIFYLFYPKMIGKSIGTTIDRELIFAMRDMLIQISSGIPLFTVIENIGTANYGYVSMEFKRVATNVKGGNPLLHELELMAIRTQSEYLKKISWQLVTAIRSGANLTATLKSVVKVLVDYQFSISKSFNAELNFIILIFMLLSAVLPTIGTTVLVIFSVFGMFGISSEVLLAVVVISFFAQAGIVAYVYTKRPNFFS